MKIFLNISICTLLCFCAFGQRPELVIPFGHTNAVTDVGFSRDGKTILTASLDATVKLWDTDGREIYTFKGHTDYVSNAVFTPDGRAVLSSSADGTARLWNLKGGLIQTFHAAPDSEITAIAISPDGRLILLGDIEGGIKLYDTAGNNIWSFNYDADGAIITALAFSPDGRSVLCGLSGIEGTTAQLWDTHGKLLHTLKGDVSDLSDAAFSPDGATILTAASGGKVHLWNRDGTALRSFSAHESGLNALAVSPDGQKILTGSDDGTVRLWDNKGKQLQVFAKQEAEVISVAFSPDGQLVLAGSWDGTTNLWHIDGRPLKALRGHTQPAAGLVFSPDGRTLWLDNGGQTLNLLDIDGPDLKVLRGHSDFVNAVVFSADGSRLLSSSGDGTARLWTRTGQELQSFGEPLARIYSIALSPDGKTVLTGHDDSIARMWDSTTGKLQGQFGGHDGGVSSVAFSPDGKDILTLSGDNTIKLWDRQGNLQQSFGGNTSRIKTASFSPDGQYVMAETDRGRLRWVRRDQTMQSQELDIENLSNVLVSPGGQRILTQGADNSLQLRDLKGQVLQSFATRPIVGYSAVDYISPAMAFSPDEQVVVRSDWDHTIRWWRVEDGQELGSLIVVDSLNWIVTTPSGLFDASPGAMSLLYYSIFDENAYEIIELEQLKARYYEPGLLQKLLGMSNERIRPVDGLDQVALYPEISASIENDQLRVQLRARSGGIGAVSVFVNGKEVANDANPQRAAGITYDLKQIHSYLLRHPDSTNIVSLRAYNQEGWLKSPSIDLVYRPLSWSKGSSGNSNATAWQGQLDPKMYVLAVGTSDYTGTQMDLKYATQDATLMARALQSVGGNLFANGDSIEVYCLTTAAPDSTGLEGTSVKWQYASKENVRTTLEAIRKKAKAEDVLLVYLSGHGLTYGGAEQSQFYYLTGSIAGEEMIGDADLRNKYTISSGELTEWINSIAALKQVLVIDACNSGKVVENLTGGTRNLNSSQIRALDRMKDRTGMFILSGSAADKVSYEASEYGQGLLTYSLLQGMLGIATRKTADGDYVDVMKLFQYARDEVPRLAATINGIQTPMLGFPKTGASFDIGVVDQNTKIPIGNKKPVMIRPIFLNQATLTDDLGLVKLLEAEFRAETEKGKDADLIYVDVTDYPGAYSLSGLYTKNADEIHLTVKLFVNGQDTKDLEVPPADDPQRLVRYILREVKRVLR